MLILYILTNLYIYIVAELVVEPDCSIDTLKNNSKMIGNVLGAEVDYFEGKQPKHGGYFFLDK